MTQLASFSLCAVFVLVGCSANAGSGDGGSGGSLDGGGVDADVLDADVLDADVLDADVLDADVLDADVLDTETLVPDSTTPQTCASTCGENATCLEQPDHTHSCQCDSFYTGDGQTCVDIDECATDNGGCDLLTTCINNVGAMAACGACPAGFAGTGTTGCTPTLTGLTLANGTLFPTFESSVTTYSVDEGIATQNVTLTPSAPPGATIAVNGEAVASGTDWTSPPLNLGNNVITIVVGRAGQPSSSYTVTVTRAHQEAYIKASNTEARDFFGYAIALSDDGNTLAVGANNEASSATGINGDQADNSTPTGGAVYVFTRTNDVWSQQAYLKASNTEAGDRFAFVMALSGDGDTLAVCAIYEDSDATGIDGNQADNGAVASGAVYVFRRTGELWSQQAYLKASNTGADDSFGISLALSADGDALAVGAYREDSDATGINGNQADNSAPDSGAVYVFARTGDVWSQQAYLKASNTGGGGNAVWGDYFGRAVALSADGNTLAVGAFSEYSNATGINGDQADDSARRSGAVYLFARTSDVWSQHAYIKASNTDAEDRFGIAVALSADGRTLAVGAHSEDSNATGIDGNQADNTAPDSGAVYVFTQTSDVWSQQAYIKASNTDAEDYFGISVALSADGNYLAVGAYFEDSSAAGINGNQADNSLRTSGAAYLFRRSGRAWSQQAYIKASNPGPSDEFGVDVGLSADGTTLAVGAYGEDSNATGINGNQADSSADGAGAVYVFW